MLIKIKICNLQDTLHDLHPTLLDKIGSLYKQPAESQQHELGRQRGNAIFGKFLRNVVVAEMEKFIELRG